MCACQPPPAHTHTLSLARASSFNPSLALWPGPAGAGAKERIITVQVDATVPAEVEACVKKVLGNVCIARKEPDSLFQRALLFDAEVPCFTVKKSHMFYSVFVATCAIGIVVIACHFALVDGFEFMLWPIGT